MTNSIKIEQALESNFTTSVAKKQYCIIYKDKIFTSKNGKRTYNSPTVAKNVLISKLASTVRAFKIEGFYAEYKPTANYIYYTPDCNKITEKVKAYVDELIAKGEIMIKEIIV